MKKFLLSIFIFAIMLSFSPIYSEDSTYKIAPNEEFYKKISEFLKEEIKDANADPEKGRYNFVVALKTSHLTSDQNNVVAMRQAACLIANNLCTAGDSISCVAWELDVWDTSKTFTLSEDGAERKQFVNALPKTTKNKSVGGQDTFNALMSILKKVENPESSIIILITNSHESRGPVGEKYSVVGKDSVELKTLLDEKGFREPEDESFNFYFENNNNNPTTISTTIYLTIVLPKNLKSLNNNEENRYPSFSYASWVPEENKPSAEVLPEPVKEDVKENSTTEVTPTEAPTPVETPIKKEDKKSSLPILPIVIGIGSLIGIVVIIFIIASAIKNSNANKNTKKTHELKFDFANNSIDQEIQEEKTYEMMFFDDTFKMRAKKVEGEEQQEGEENGEEIPEYAKVVFEVSYFATSGHYNFEFINSSVTTDPSDFKEFEDLGNNKYRIKEGFSDSLMVNFEGEDYSLMLD